MSLQIKKVPTMAQHHGLFQLPTDFDQKINAAHWIEEEQVEYASQRQVMPMTQYTVDGLKVWKGPKGKGEPTVRTTGKGKKFVLMYRSQVLQKKMNAIYGNVSKEFINREVVGETVGGAAKQDAGILTDAQLRGSQEGASMADESMMHLNDVSAPVEEPIEA